MSALSALVNRPLALELGWRGAVRNYARLASVLIAPFILVWIAIGAYWLVQHDLSAVVAALTTINVAVAGAAVIAFRRFGREADLLRRERLERRAERHFETELAFADAMQKLVADDDLDDAERLHAVERAIFFERAAVEALAVESVDALVEEKRRLRVDKPLFEIGKLVPTVGRSVHRDPISGVTYVRYGDEFNEVVLQMQRTLMDARRHRDQAVWPDRDTDEASRPRESQS